MILDENSFELFLKDIENYLVSEKELRTEMFVQIEADAEEWEYDFRPALLVDFDNKKLFTLYTESAAFEHYVPDHWIGEFRDFSDLIPVSQRYWVKDGVNYLN